jgi:hypothetical protein
MHGVNLDLLRTGPHHPDGQPKDPHAHHRAAHLADLRAARRARWSGWLARLVAAPALRKPSLPVPAARR